MVLEKIIEILADYKEMDPSKISAETSFEDLGLDSLDIVEIMMKLEDELHVTIEVNPEIKTVGKLADYIEELPKE